MRTSSLERLERLPSKKSQEALHLGFRASLAANETLDVDRWTCFSSRDASCENVQSIASEAGENRR